MKKLCIQIGHLNAQFGEAWIKPQTGAPQEQLRNKAIGFRAAEILRTKGFEVKVTDANGYLDPTVAMPTIWDMFLAIHCDADSAALSSGFTDYPDPRYDGATALSQLYANKIAEKFYPETGITYRPERRGNRNVREYYFWDSISWTTPCVLIEMGESIDPHDAVILNDTERCAVALARGVCNAFGISYEAEIPSTPPVSIIDWEKKYNESQQLLATANEKVKTCEDKIAIQTQLIATIRGLVN